MLENLPLNALIDASNQDDRAVRFRQAFLENVKNLAVRDVNLYFVKIPDEFLVQDAAPSRSELLFAMGATFFRSLEKPEGKAYEAEIAAELQRIGSTLTPFQVVVRAETQTCVGCHFVGTAVGKGSCSRARSIARRTLRSTAERRRSLRSHRPCATCSFPIGCRS